MAPLSKKRRLDSQQPAELNFDVSARQEYLSGFHKRKIARKENARETAIKRDKEERVVQRKQMRDQRKKDLEQHIAEFNAELRKQNPDLSEAESGAEVAEGEKGNEGSAADQLEDVGQEDEYVDEDKYTTVTVEAMGGSEDEEPEQRKNPELSAKPGNKATATKKRIWSKNNPADGKPKPKKHKFRYESKSERQDTRRKQKNKNQAAAKARREKST
ncbi:hypothetical protein LTR91_006567 [Friedmanniomyces endolithicus]|uniref:Ribosomal RNA-processing protein 17 n=1 Tax=Friedmanniomyces endolithicus TaxID=329885 RepID=A0AAN6FLQ1_9PEZI|nr:hypothetical protein LTR35_006626 [Friedmanniomyces endolithicus]KAK0297112.1 hypothetical protein LTS00_004391 [Friedmanniomyces endolithicus]KAK0320681.1 hypothetical protein LTR82_008394 [Friedmanniomyces endolithicus]KAK0928085.1 hypothetical protein LTR57_002819 [Friedmanniomyces endolithicus]KAK0997600.1 hypothetical protein LTR91_006567 [Friedmanniomyces endolithicus]